MLLRSREATSRARARQVAEWTALVAAGASLGVGVAWLQEAFGIPRNVVGWFWIVLMVAATGFAGWAAWGYYGAVRDEDEPE